MPFDGSGNFTRVHNWQQDRDNGIRILADRHDAEDDNFGSAFNLTFLRTGTVPMTGNLQMGGNAIRNVDAGSEAAPSLTFELSNSTGIWQPSPTSLAVSIAAAKRFEVNTTGVGIFGDTAFSGNVVIGGDINAASFHVAAAGNGWLGAQGGNLLLNFDDNDYMVYDKVGNSVNFVINSTGPAYINSSGIHANGGVTATGDITSGGNMSATGDFWASALHISGAINTNGLITSSVGVGSPSFNVSNLVNAYIGSAGGNMIINFDAGDYMMFDRATNAYRFEIGGFGTPITLAAGGVGVYAPMTVNGALSVAGTYDFSAYWGHFTNVSCDALGAQTGGARIAVNSSLSMGGDIFTNGRNIFGGAGNTSLNLHAGSTFNTDGASIVLRGNTTGYNNHGMEFYAFAAERMRITDNVRIYAGLYLDGTLAFSNSPSGYIAADAGFFTISMDAGDYIQHDRAANIMTLGVSGAQFQVGAGYAIANNQLRIYDSNFYLNCPTADVPGINFDNNDWMRYVRSSNVYEFIIGGGVVTSIRGGGIHTAGSVEAGFQLFVGGVPGIAGRAQVLDYGGCAIQTWTTTGDYTCMAFNRLGAQVGSITCNATNTYYNATSDIRLKDAIADAGDGSGSVIDAIKIRRFKWKNNDDQVEFGTIAQELHDVFPLAVHVGSDKVTEAEPAREYQPATQDVLDEDGTIIEYAKQEVLAYPGHEAGLLLDPWAVDYSKMVPLLIREIQLLRRRVAHIEAHVHGPDDGH